LPRRRPVASPQAGRARVGKSALAKPIAALPMAALPMAALLLLPFASNSMSRGAQEAASAIARGSVLGDPLARTAELITTLGLAALPLFAFGSIGILIAVRNPTTALRFVHAPALIYLAAVVGLLAAGAYSGSGRYLYPALPSLALLAASALDRQRTIVRLATAASGALLARSEEHTSELQSLRHLVC